MSNRPSHTAQRTTAIILAGGASSRMNHRPKALLEWRGRHFIEYIVERLRPQVDAIAISSSQNDLYGNLALPILPDPFPDRRGPLAGILAGLYYSRSDYTLFVPCDNPLLTPTLCERLLAALDATGADIAYACSSGDRHYLYALMRTSLRESLADHLARNDYAVRRWYDRCNSIAVNFDDCAGSFININTPTALADFIAAQPKVETSTP